MPDDNRAQSLNDWPSSKFTFSVKIGNMEGLFQEVTGLNAETQVIEYRRGNKPISSTVKMPGIKKPGNITLKRGLFKNDTRVWDLYKQVAANAFKKTAITISLLDESHTTVMSWTLANAVPVKISSTDMKADANDVAIESMELTHEGLEIAHA